jgi:hypothetical protein
MKFKNYLNESIDINDIISLIEKDCKPFINDWKKHISRQYHKWLMSGRKNRVVFEKKQVRQDRRPKDLPMELHNFIDVWFQKKLGVKARSKSIFTSFNPNLADQYGTLHLIFPIGKYKAISSESIYDIYELYEGAIQYIDYAVEEWSYLNDDEKNTVFKMINDELHNGEYTDDLTFHNNEIMVVCKEVYIVNSKYHKELLEYFMEQK